VAAVADRDGVTYTREAGVRQAGEPAAMTQDTIFWLASMTKAIVSVAALREVEARFRDGRTDAAAARAAALAILEGGAPAFRVEYLAMVDYATWMAVDVLRPGVLVAVAGRLGRTRLIDNVLLDQGSEAHGSLAGG
jgi:pantothenate synthetase